MRLIINLDEFDEDDPTPDYLSALAKQGLPIEISISGRYASDRIHVSGRLEEAR